MSHIHVQSTEDATDLERDLTAAERFALDCEAAGFHRYTDRLCLVQVSVGADTYVVDPLAFDCSALLRAPLEDPQRGVVMHGADFDLRLLKRDLGIRLRGLIDTQVAAALLGEDGLGLASLLESRLGVKLSKRYQRADWAKRPLEEGMLEYAADDTRYLLDLADVLLADLEKAGRMEWAREEWEALERVVDEADGSLGEPDDPVVRVKGARRLSPRQVTAVREALVWRDEIARSKDRAPFRVVGDPPLIEAALSRPRRSEELVQIKGFPRALARGEGRGLIRRLERVAHLPEEELIPYPTRVRRGPGRPDPELEQVIDRLKEIRNRRADEIGLPRGTLVSNAVLQSIARAAPRDHEELISVDGMRRWKADVLGPDLLETLRNSA